MNDTTEIPDATTTAATTPADVDEAPAASADEGGSRYAAKLRLVGRAASARLRSPGVRIGAAALILFAVATGGIGIVLRAKSVARETSEATPAVVESVDAIGTAPIVNDMALQGLSAVELVALAKSSVTSGDFDTAERLLEQARMNADPTATTLQRDLHALLAEVAEAHGRTTHAAIHRDYVDRLELDIGAPVAVFREAEAALARGELEQARRLFSRFLLRENELTLEREVWVTRCRDRLAEVAAMHFSRIAGNPEKPSTEPRSYFR